MAVVGAAEPIADGRGGADDKENNHTYRRKFRVITDAAHDGAKIVLAAPFLPNIGDQYQTDNENDPSSFCQSRTATAIDRLVWHVDVEYSPTPPIEENRPKISGGFERFHVPIVGLRDQEYSIGDAAAGKPFAAGIANSFGDPFDPPPTFEDARPFVVIEKLVPTLNSLMLIMYANAVNSDLWAGAKARQAKVVDLSWEKEWKTVAGLQVPQFRMRYKICFNRDTWDLLILDAGQRYKADVADTAGTPFEDSSGNRCTGLLDGDAINGFAGGRKTTGQAPYFIRKRIHPELPFAALNLPQDFNV